MIRSIVTLPPDAGEDFEVYINGVLQQPDIDYYSDRELIFDRRYAKTTCRAGAGS